MHSIVLTSTLAALNDPSYMYAAVWPKNVLFYPYKMHFITFWWINSDSRLSARCSFEAFTEVLALLSPGLVSRPDDTSHP